MTRTLARTVLAIAAFMPAQALACGMIFERDAQLFAMMEEVDNAEVSIFEGLAEVEVVMTDAQRQELLDQRSRLAFLSDKTVSEVFGPIPAEPEPAVETAVSDLDDPTAIFELADADLF